MKLERPTTTDELPAMRSEADDDGSRLQAVDDRGGVARALQLFATGVLGGGLTIFGLAFLAIPTTHRCCGASASQRAADAETKRRCMELGVTPEELAALDAAADERPRRTHHTDDGGRR